MTNIINFFTNNYQTICTALCAVILVASLIVKLTPTVKDNKLLEGLIDILDRLSVVKTAKDKKYIDFAKEVLGEKEEEQ